MGRLVRGVLAAVGALFLVASAATASAASVPSSGAISAGQNFTCGIRTDGTLVCWGDPSLGWTIPLGTFSQVSSGFSHACAVRTDATLACWGDDASGQTDAPTGTFSQVSSGGFAACGVRTGGNLACWGSNVFHLVSNTPSGTFSQVSAGYFHTCGLRTVGTVTCWGDNSSGQAPLLVEGTFTEVSSGGSTSTVEHTCGLRTDGTLACWGDNSLGQVSPLPGGTFSQVSSGGAFSCAIQTDGTPVCWGDNLLNQATPPAEGLGPPADTTPPVITLPANITAEATGPSGAVVTYAVSAIDPDDPATVSCSPASGTTFPLGVTTVACTATDTNGNTSSASFTVTVVDTTPPVVTISVASPVEATGSSGAAVTYTATAVDIVSGSLTPNCLPASGSTFPLGTTTITCSATDGAGNTGTATATVVVEDKTAPNLSLPANITVVATSASGAVVTYAVSATDPDNLTSDLTVSCSPPSGSTFPVGVTTVNCIATDPAGNTSTGSFQVTVSQVTVADFSIGPISAITVPVGGTASSTVTVNSLGGFNSAVALSASGAPAGVSVTFNPTSVTPTSGGSSSSTLTLHLSPMVTPTTFTLTVTGTFAGVSHSSTASVTVTVSSPAIADVVGQLQLAGCIDNAGIANALTAKLTAEQGAIGGGSTKTAINILSAFTDQVRAQSGKHITADCATALMTDARSLIDSLAVTATPNPITGSVHTASGLGIAGAVLTLKDSAGTTVATATTDITGFYFFATTGLLTPGATYTVNVTVPIGFTAASAASQTFAWTGGAEVSLADFTTT